MAWMEKPAGNIAQPGGQNRYSVFAGSILSQGCVAPNESVGPEPKWKPGNFFCDPFIPFCEARPYSLQIGNAQPIKKINASEERYHDQHESFECYSICSQPGRNGPGSAQSGPVVRTGTEITD